MSVLSVNYIICIFLFAQILAINKKIF